MAAHLRCCRAPLTSSSVSKPLPLQSMRWRRRGQTQSDRRLSEVKSLPQQDSMRKSCSTGPSIPKQAINTCKPAVSQRRCGGCSAAIRTSLKESTPHLRTLTTVRAVPEDVQKLRMAEGPSILRAQAGSWTCAVAHAHVMTEHSKTCRKLTCCSRSHCPTPVRL